MGDERTTKYVSDRLGKHVAFIPSIQQGVNGSENEQENWSASDSLGLNEGFVKGLQTTDTETWSTAIGHSSAYSNTASTSYGSSDNTSQLEKHGFFLGWRPVDKKMRQHSMGTNFSASNANTQTETRSSTESQGGSKSKGVSESVSTGKNSQHTDQTGQSRGSQKGWQYSVTYTPHILPRLEPSDVEALLGADNGRSFLCVMRMARGLSSISVPITIKFLCCLCAPKGRTMRRCPPLNLRNLSVIKRPGLQAVPQLSFMPGIQIDFPAPQRQNWWLQH